MDQVNTINIPLEGVESDHCALIVDRELEKIPGIRSHRVELNNRRAVIDSDDPREDLPRAVRAIRDIGYGVSTVKNSFPVTGMSCASCAASAQTMVGALPGVVDAQVNFATGNLQVEYIPGEVSPGQMRQSVQSIGYDLVIEEGEKVAETLEELHEEKLRSLRIRTIWSVILSVPLVLISMVFMNIPFADYIMWALATPVVMVFGRQFFINAWRQAKHRSANMDSLVAMSTGLAYLFSVFNILYPQFWTSRGLEAHVYFEVASVVIAFILLGKLLEERAKASTSSAIKKLMGLQPKTVVIVHGNEHLAEIPVEQVKTDDIIQMRPGEKIAVDGEVVSGSSFVDESMISGEPVPVEKQAGAKVFAGTINQKGSFRFRAQKVGADTLLAQIIRLVQQAQGSRAPVQKLVDRIASIFVPVVIGIAVLAFISWALLGGANGVTQGLMAFITVLVIACPCALGLATPTAIMVGVGKGAGQGILIRDAEALELSHRVNAIVLDKTGTITEGKPRVTGIQWKSDSPRLRQILYTMETSSEHPLASAITEYLRTSPISIEHVQSVTGAGITATFEGRNYYAGTPKLLQQNGINIPADLGNWGDEMRARAHTVVFFAGEDQVYAAIAIADAIREGSKQAIAELKNSGIDVYMFTGDNRHTAAAVADEVGIENFRAEVMPQDKEDFVRELQEKGRVVAMVGDGINDSQALARADVGIAMGRGSDIAMDVARMTLITSDLRRLPQALKLSGRTVRTIRQNLFWAFIYNIIGIPVAAGALYPFTGFLLNPMIAGAAMALSSVSVVANSLRLKWSGTGS